MSDYTKTTDFAAKDALASGSAGKVARGSEIDVEFNNIETAIATKFDSDDRNVANGLAGLDASGLISSTQLPQATELAIGAVELATAAEVAALTDAVRAITPATLSGGLAAYISAQGDGLLEDVANFTDPNANEILFWNDGTNGLDSRPIGPGLSFSLFGDIRLDKIGLQDLNDDPGADFLLGFESGAGASSYVGIGAGLQWNNPGTPNISLATQNADSTSPIGVDGSGGFTYDHTSLTNVDSDDLTSSASVLVRNGADNREISIQEMGFVIEESTAAQTFALSDRNTLQLLTGATDRTWTIPANATAAIHIGAVIYVGSRDTALLTIAGAGGVTVQSALGSGNRTVAAGGLAALVKVAVNTWMVTGDIT